jgi:hypothetical protein
MSSRISWDRFYVVIGSFLVIFGIMNFAELLLGWKDRTEQFTRYLSKTVAPLLGFDAADGVQPALWGVKSVELLLGLVALAGTVAAWRGSYRIAMRVLAVATSGWLVVFSGMSAMDVWAADRAELQEHTLYFVGFAMLLLVVLGVYLARRLSDVLPRLEGVIARVSEDAI